MDKSRASHITGQFVRWLEIALAFVVVVASMVSLVFSIIVLIESDWTAIDTFYEAVNRILLVVIGLELARMLIVHNLLSVLELLAFIVARKMLTPELQARDVVLGAFAFVVLIAARYGLSYYHRKLNSETTLFL